MKTLLVSFAVVALFGSSMAQTVADEIDRDVWHPFVKTFSSFDDPGFIAVHTHDVVRVSRDGATILVGNDYVESIRNNFAQGRETETVRTIEFTFTERLHKDKTAFEVGYYRIRSARGGQEYVGYGKFQVVLRKVDGRWKIAVDSDTSEDGSILEEDFMSGAPLRF